MKTPQKNGGWATLYSKDVENFYTRENKKYRLARKTRIKINNSFAMSKDILDFSKFIVNSNIVKFWKYNQATNIYKKMLKRCF